MSQQSVQRTAGGLVRNPNALSEVPEGAMVVAKNSVITRPGVIEKRRGFKAYGTLGVAAEQLHEYDDTLLYQAGSTLAYDSDAVGTYVPYSGSYARPDATVRSKSLESQGTIFLTTDAGVMRTDDIETAPTRAGIPGGLDLTLTPSGIGGGWFDPDSQVGYRIVWGRIDRTDRLLIGAPSMRETAFNSLSGTLNWTRSGTGPWDITVSHTAHGYSVSDIIEVYAPFPAPGSYTLTAKNANDYTFSIASDPGASGTAITGKARDVTVRFTLPDDILEGDFYDIYRTELSASDTADPGDRQKRVVRYAIEAADVTMTGASTTVTVAHTSHGFASGDVLKVYQVSDDALEEGRHIITVTGTHAYTYTVAAAPANGTAKVILMHVEVIDDWDLPLGEELYTDVSQEGILKANTRPPFSKDIALYKDTTFYANTKKEHFVQLQLISIASLVDDTSAITLTQGAVARTYTFSTAEALATRKFKRYTAEATTSLNISKTAKSLCRIINQDPGSLYYAWYTSGILDAPGEIVIETREINTSAFSVTCNNATTAAAFSPSLPTSGTDFSSFDQSQVNRLYRAKPQQPEAVPDLDFDDIGDASNAILRILPLRDSLIIATEGGLYRLSGDDDSTFVVRQLDPTVRAVAPDTWVVLDNAVFGFSTSGIIRATESGTQLISWPIDSIFAELQTYDDFETLCHAVAYESEGLYIIWAPETSDDTTANVAWCYSTLTRKWTGPWTQPAKAAIVLSSDQKLYLAQDGGLDAVLQERKTYATDRSDFIDEEVSATADAVSTVEYAGATRSTVDISGWTYYQDPDEGWLFRKDPSTLPFSKILLVETLGGGSFRLTLEDNIPGLTAGASKIGVGIDQVVEWTPEDADNPSSLKQFQNVQIYFEKRWALNNELTYYSDVVATPESTGVVSFDPGDGGVLLRDPVPTQHQRCRTLSVSFQNKYGLESAPILHIAYDVRLTGSRTMGRSQ